MSYLSTNSSTSSSSAYATASSSKRMSGLMSGLDTDELVKQFTIGLQNKIDSQLQKKQVASWQQEAYQSVIKAVSEFQSKYFNSTTSSNSILNASFFNTTSIINNSPYVNVSGSAAAAKNMKISSVNQLAKQASFLSNHKVSNQKIQTGEIKAEWEKSTVTGSTLSLSFEGKDYTLTVGKDGGTTTLDKVTEQLNEQLTELGLKDKVSFELSSDKTSVTLKSIGDSSGSNIKINSGSEALLKSLGIAKDASGTEITGTTDATALYTKANLDESLAGSTLTFNLNGLSRTVSFNETERGEYDTPEKLANFLQKKLNSSYGFTSETPEKSIKVSNDNGKLSLQVVGSDGKTSTDTDTFTIVSSSKSGVLGINGALKVYAGESNRLNTNKTLKDVAVNLSDSGLTPSAPKDPENPPASSLYRIEINGKEFEFEETESIEAILKKINNDPEANVTITYSNTLDTFQVVAKTGGASSKVNIVDKDGGTLAKTLFGSSNVNVQNGQDAEIMVSLADGLPAQKITRSSNNFTLDGVDFELLKTTPTKNADGTDFEPITFTPQNKTDDLVTKIKEFIEDYNNILTTVNTFTDEKKPTDGKYLPLTDAQKADMSESQIASWEKKAKQGLLFNDSLLSSFALDWRHAMTDQVDSISSALYEIGISSTKYSEKGKLTIDEDKLKKALNENPEKVASLFTGSDGIATRMQDVMTKYTKDSLVNTGLLITKAGSTTSAVDQSDLAKKMRDYDTQVKELKVRLSSQQEIYYNKFTALEKYISQMNTQASFFTSFTST